MSSEVSRAIELFGADLGVIFDWGAERIRLVTEKGVLLDGDTALHAMVDLWCRTSRDRRDDRGAALSVAGGRRDRGASTARR